MNSPAPDSSTFHLVLAETDQVKAVAVPIAYGASPEKAAKWSIGPGAMRKVIFDETHPSGTKEQPAAVTAWFECIQVQNEPQLLLVTDDPGQVRLNGAVPPLIAVVRDGDLLRFGTELSLTVRLERDSPVGAARLLEVIGQVCPVCLTTLEAEDTAYRCPCGRVYHWNSEDNSRLQCGLTLGSCLGCEQPVASATRALSQGEAIHE